MKSNVDRTIATLVSRMNEKRFRHGACLYTVCAAFVTLFALLTANAVYARVADEPVAADTTTKLTFGGFERTYHLHVPKDFEAASKKSLPLLIMLHGAGGDGLQVARQTGWNETADKEKFFAAYPDALPANPKREASFRLNPRFWDDASKRGQAVRGAIDDVGFLGAVIDDLEKRYPIDATRIYLTGFSSGASMTFHAVTSPLSARIAAAAPVSGRLFSPDTLKIVRATPLLLIFGTKDPLNPLEGGPAPTPWNPEAVAPKVSETVDTWAKLTGCPGTPVLISEDGGVRRVAYGPGKDGVEFLFYTVDGLGHHWPGSKTEALPESIGGALSNKLDATDAIWKFLSRHTLSARAEAP